MPRVLALAIVLMLAIPFVEAQSGRRAPGAARPLTTLQMLNQRLPEVSFIDTPLEQVFDFVSELTRANVVIKWQLLTDNGISRDKPITIKAKNLKLSQFLWMLMNEVGGSDLKLAYRASGNLIIFSTDDDLGKEMVIKVYDISDLLLRIPNASSRSGLDASQALQGAQGGGGGGNLFQQNDDNENDQQNQDPTGAGDPYAVQLVSLIRDTIEPDSWAQNGGSGTIHMLRGQLVVRNTILVHQKLGGYLTDEQVSP
jgi:hypothetical protein